MTTLEDLRAGGRLVSTGTFDLDPARAREKLARYQLVDPHRYVLQFVQAAQLLGATHITADIDADEVEMSFDGESPSAEELQEIYLHAFGQRGIRRLEALRHLALGVIAAEAVEPAVIRVAGTGGTLTVRDATENVAAEDTTPHNDIYVRERARLGHLVEFIRTFRGKTAEEIALQDARFATPRLVVNGEIINEPKRRPKGSIPIKSAQESGWVAAGRGDAMLTLVQHGVALEQVAFSIGTLSIGGVIKTTRLTTNLSQSAFVRNHMWDALIETVVTPAALRAADAFLSRQLRTANRPAVTAMTAAALRCRIDLARRGESVSGVDNVIMRWADVDVWERLETKADASSHLSTQELFNEIGEGPVFLSTVQEELDVVRHRGSVVPHVLLVPRDRRALNPELLAEATGRDVVDVTDDVRAVVRQRGDRQFGDRYGLRYVDDVLRLEKGQWVHIEETRSEGVRVELGVPGVCIRQSASVIVVTENVVRLRLEVPCELLGGSTMLIAVDEPTDEPPAEILRAAAPLVARAAVQLLDIRGEGAIRLPTEMLVDLLYAAATGDIVGRICVALGWGDEVPDGLLEELLGARDSDDGWVGSLTTSAAGTPLFERVGSRERVSIRELSNVWPIRFVAAGSRRRALQIAWELELVGGAAVVWLDERERAILKWTLGSDALEDVEADLHAAAARIQRGRTGLEEAPVLHGLFIRKRAIEGEGVHGEVGMTEAGGASSFIELVVLHEGKRLAHRELSCGDGQFRAIVESTLLTPTPDMSEVLEDDAYMALARRISSVCEELFEAWCVRQMASDEPPNEVDQLTLWRAVARASADRYPHRLGWKVFATTDGLLDAGELSARTREAPLTVSSRQLDGQFVVFVPLAATEHVAALSRVLPHAAISRARHAVAPSFVPPQPSGHSESSVSGDHADLVRGLRASGVAVDSVEVVAGSRLSPTLRERHLSIGELHPLALDAPVRPWAVAALAIAVARGPNDLAGALQRLGRLRA